MKELPILRQVAMLLQHQSLVKEAFGENLLHRPRGQEWRGRGEPPRVLIRA